MVEQIVSGLNPHKGTEELLPWYATGQLDDDERALVEQHLSVCAHCRRQLAFDRRMINDFASLTPEADAGWMRLRRRVEARQSWRRRTVRAAAAARQVLSRPAIAALAVAQLAFVVLAASLLTSLSRPSYRALGSAPPPQSANAILMFRPDTTEPQLRLLLRSNGVSLVGGPTSADAYLVHVPLQTRPAVLARLGSDQHVTMAEPIDGGGS